MTHDQRSLLTAILSDPEDDMPRMKYADWCEENGDGERAAFIRVQMELARLRPFSGPTGTPGQIWVRAMNQNEVDMDDLQRQLLAKNVRHWLPSELIKSWPDLLVVGNGTVVKKASWSYREFIRFGRGFANECGMSCADWQAHADKLTWWPARKCECQQLNGNVIKVKCEKCFRTEGELPGATDTCPDRPWKQPGLSGPTCYTNKCKTCSGIGRIPRPVTLAMQPITEVTLTTWPTPTATIGLDGGRHWAWLRSRWPSVKHWGLPREVATV